MGFTLRALFRGSRQFNFQSSEHTLRWMPDVQQYTYSNSCIILQLQDMGEMDLTLQNGLEDSKLEIKISQISTISSHNQDIFKSHLNNYSEINNMGKSMSLSTFNIC